MAFQLFSNDYLTIDIGFRNIKVIQARKKKGNDLTIVNYGIGDTPRGSIRNGEIGSRDRVVSEIRKIMNDNGINSKEAKIIMSGTNIVTRVILMDKVAGASDERRIWEEIYSYLPVNMDEYRVDFKVLGSVTEEGSEKLKVFVTAVPKRIVSSYVDILKSLNLKPISVDIPANSVSKFFQKDLIHTEPDNWSRRQRYSKINTNTIAVIDMGSETTIVNILKDKVPEFNRVILSGGSNIDALIQKKLNLEAEQMDKAERFKKMYGILPENGDNSELECKCSDAVKQCLDGILKNIKHCFSFYTDKCAGEKVSRIYLVGGGSQLKGLREYMEEALRIPVYPINLVNVSGIGFSPGLNTEKVNFLINAIGVAL